MTTAETLYGIPHAGSTTRSRTKEMLMQSKRMNNLRSPGFPRQTLYRNEIGQHELSMHVTEEQRQRRHFYIGNFFMHFSVRQFFVQQPPNNRNLRCDLFFSYVNDYRLVTNPPASIFLLPIISLRSTNDRKSQ